MLQLRFHRLCGCQLRVDIVEGCGDFLYALGGICRGLHELDKIGTRQAEHLRQILFRRDFLHHVLYRLHGFCIIFIAHAADICRRIFECLKHFRRVLRHCRELFHGRHAVDFRHGSGKVIRNDHDSEHIDRIVHVRILLQRFLLRLISRLIGFQRCLLRQQCL